MIIKYSDLKLNKCWGVNHCDNDKREAGDMGVREAKEENRVTSRVKMLYQGQSTYLAHSRI